jgi:class 3 adenylate cyclase
VGSLCNLHVLTEEDRFSLRVDESLGIQEAQFSGIPQKAAQIMAIIENHNSKALLVWAAQKPIVLAIVFSDVTDSAVLSQQLGDFKWQEILQKHFACARSLAEKNNGFFVKEIGDGLMALFHDAVSALDFTIELRDNPVDSKIVVHQGAHLGTVIVKQNDAVGTNVDLTNRVVNKASRGEIVVTDEFWNDIQLIKSAAHSQLPWKKSPNNTLKGFEGTFVLWQA